MTYAVGKNVTMTMTMPDGSERVIRGSIMSDEQMKAQYAKLPERQTFGPSDKLRWPCRGDERKHVSDKSCPDDCCMPGLNGKCVACGDEQ